MAPHTGKVLAHPALVTITFPGYAHQSQVEAWGGLAVKSEWLAKTGGEYGIGAGTHVAKVLPGPVPATLSDTGVEDLLAARVADGTLPKPTPDTIYMLYVAPEIDATGADGLCSAATDAYHYFSGPADTAYAVIGDCHKALDDITATAAHELIEAATDPTIASYFVTLAKNNPWAGIGDGEASDLCDWEPYWYEGGFAFERAWSNAAVKAGTDPCVPAPAAPFFDVSASPNKMPVVAAGGSAGFVLTGWSSAPLPDWKIHAEGTGILDFDPAATLDASVINNGKTAMLTLKAPANAPSGARGAVVVVSGGVHAWPVGIIVK